MDFNSEIESYCLGTSITLECLLHKPEHMTKIVISSKAIKNKELDKLLELSNMHNIPIIYDDDIISHYSLKENCYCIGFFNRYSTVLSADRHIVCYGFKDIGQLGTIFRSAVSFNFRDIALINTDIDYFDPRVVRSSMGALFLLSVASYNSLEEYISEYEHNIYCFNTTNVNELSSLKPVTPYSIILSEDQSLLNDKFKDGYYIKHKGNDLSLSALSSIVFNYCYEKGV